VRRSPHFFEAIDMAHLPPPITTTEIYLARIVQQNDEIIALMKTEGERPKTRRLKEPKP